MNMNRDKEYDFILRPNLKVWIPEYKCYGILVDVLGSIDSTSDHIYTIYLKLRFFEDNGEEMKDRIEYIELERCVV